MKNFIGLFGLAFILGMSICNQPVQAQSPDIKWGEVIKASSKSHLSYIIGSDDQGFYALRTRSGNLLRSEEYSIERFNSSMNMEFSKEIELPEYKGDKVSLERIMLAQDQLVLFTSLLDKRNNQYLAFLNQVSPDGALSKMRTVDQIEGEKKLKTAGFNFTMSADQSKILVYHDNPYDKRGEESFAFKVLDNNLEELWQRDVQLPYSDKEIGISQYRVDNDGNIYVLASRNLAKSEREKGDASHEYILFNFKKGEETLTEYNLNLGQQVISEITINVDNEEGQIICAGFYSERSVAGLKGTFFLRINRESKEVEVQSVKEFDRDFLALFMSEKRAKKGKELYNYDLHNLIIRKDGGAVLVGEQYYVRVSTSTSSNGVTTTTYHYYYNDIIVVNINPDGGIDWINKVAKRQHSVNDGGYYSSYALLVGDESLHFIFNDHKKNQENYDLKKIKVLNNPRKGITTIASLSAAGEVKKKPLFNIKDQDVITRPKSCKSFGDNQLILYGIRGRNTQFALLSLE
ncbi:MAG: hypothetical protein WD077_11530 [Bacteroidia bacterium]